MNTKDYINKFEEIANLPATEQEVLLERARYEAFTKLKLNGKSALITLLNFAVPAAFVIPTAVYIQYPSIYNFIALAIGLILGNRLDHILQKGLLHQGLTSILNKDAKQN